MLQLCDLLLDGCTWKWHHPDMNEIEMQSSEKAANSTPKTVNLN